MLETTATNKYASLPSVIGLFFFLLLCRAGISHADTIVYGANAYGLANFIEINLTHGFSEWAGNASFETQAIDQDPTTGYVYYFEWKDTGSKFAYWDPITGASTMVRAYDPAPGIYPKQMAFSPDNQLYMLTNNDRLYTIDKQTGELSLEGQVTGLGTGSLGRTGDFAFAPDGTLYVATYQELYELDLDTLSATLLYSNLIEEIDGYNVWAGLAYCDGLLYAANIEEATTRSAIFSIDPATGAVNRLFSAYPLVNDLSSCPSSSLLNHPPALDALGSKTVAEGELLEFGISAFDSDGDQLTYSARELPTGASFSPDTQIFSWRPEADDGGNHTVELVVTDDGTPPRSDTEKVVITVNTVEPPVMATLTGQTDTEDTAIASQYYAFQNFGGSPLNIAIGSSGNVAARSMIKWDLLSIPPGSVILRAEMSLYARTFAPKGHMTIDAYRLLQPWIEGTLDYQDRRVDDPDSACWAESGFGIPWDEGGAGGSFDRDPSILAVTTNAGDGWYSWDITSAVQHWIDGDWANDGLILQSRNENVSNLKYFYSSEFQDESVRPELVVEYIAPDPNHPPELDPIGNQTVDEGELLEFTVTASDPDNDNLIFSTGVLPPGASFDPDTGVFSWTPEVGQAGYYNLLFTVTDDRIPVKSDSEEIEIKVGDANRRPVLDPIGDRSVDEGDVLAFTVTASDPDSDNLMLSTGVLPSGASFDPDTGVFSWTPEAGQAGSYTVLFTVTDDGNPAQSDSEEITVTVNAPAPIDITLSGEGVTTDTMIVDRGYSLLNFGGSPNLYIGSLDNFARGLIKWDLSSIPAGSTILNAEMSFYSRIDVAGGEITINAYRALRPWVEGTARSLDRQTDDPDSACWVEYGNGVPWGAQGASGSEDRAQSVLASTTNSGTGWYTWNVTSAVQHWVDGDWDNNGLVLMSNDESARNAKVFVPSEYSDQSLVPVLHIEYALP